MIGGLEAGPSFYLFEGCRRGGARPCRRDVMLLYKRSSSQTLLKINAREVACLVLRLGGIMIY